MTKKIEKNPSDKIKPLRPQIREDDKEVIKQIDRDLHASTKPSLADSDILMNANATGGLSTPNINSSNKELPTEEMKETSKMALNTLEFITKSSEADDKILPSAIQRIRLRKESSVDLGSSTEVVKVKQLAMRRRKRALQRKRKLSVHGKSATNSFLTADKSEEDIEGDDEKNDTYTKFSKKKDDSRLRKNAFEEADLKIKERKRKMYLHAWDAGLEAGRKRKIKIKDSILDEDLYPKENPFHRIQQSMLSMKQRKARGHQATSMKKKRLKLKR